MALESTPTVTGLRRVGLMGVYEYRTVAHVAAVLVVRVADRLRQLWVWSRRQKSASSSNVLRP